jgi:hypothetical protein
MDDDNTQWVRAHEELTNDGKIIGKDPTKIPIHELRFIGVRPIDLIDVIRERCIDCKSNESDSEEAVRNCRKIDCISWPYRMGINPFKPLVIRKEPIKKKKIVKSKTWYYP